jgi:hypothetical protein
MDVFAIIDTFWSSNGPVRQQYLGRCSRQLLDGWLRCPVNVHAVLSQSNRLHGLHVDDIAQSLVEVNALIIGLNDVFILDSLSFDHPFPLLYLLIHFLYLLLNVVPLSPCDGLLLDFFLGLRAGRGVQLRELLVEELSLLFFFHPVKLETIDACVN